MFAGELETAREVVTLSRFADFSEGRRAIALLILAQDEA
jgi:hypothetical protein